VLCFKYVYIYIYIYLYIVEDRKNNNEKNFVSVLSEVASSWLINYRTR